MTWRWRRRSSKTPHFFFHRTSQTELRFAFSSGTFGDRCWQRLSSLLLLFYITSISLTTASSSAHLLLSEHVVGYQVKRRSAVFLISSPAVSKDSVRSLIAPLFYRINLCLHVGPNKLLRPAFWLDSRVVWRCDRHRCVFGFQFGTDEPSSKCAGA